MPPYAVELPLFVILFAIPKLFEMTDVSLVIEPITRSVLSLIGRSQPIKTRLVWAKEEEENNPNAKREEKADRSRGLPRIR